MPRPLLNDVPAMRDMPRLPSTPVTPDIDALLKRYEKAAAKKERWRSVLDDIYTYFLPNRNRFDGALDGSGDRAGQRKTDEIFDSTAPKAMNKLAGRLQQVLYPAFREWVKLEAGSDVPKEDRQQVNELLEEQTEILFEHIDASNFSSAVHESSYDLIVGTGTLMVQPGSLEEPLDFSTIPLSEIVPEEGPNGRILTTFRMRRPAARSITMLYPSARLTAELLEMIRDSPDKEVPIIECVVYDPPTATWEYVVIAKAQKHALIAERLEQSPVVCHRWSKLPGETLGRGPCFDAYPNVRTVNAVKKFTLQNAQMAISPPILTGPNGIVNAAHMAYVPGGLNVVEDVRDVLTLESKHRFDVANLLLADEREAIKEAMFVSRASPGQGAVRSATEWLMLQKELLDDIGGNFPRLYGELLFPIVQKATHILVQRGKMAPVRVDGRDATVRFIGPLAKAQDEDDLLAIQRFSEVMAPWPQEVTALKVKIEDIAPYVANKTGLPASLLRSDQEAAAAQQQAGAMANQQIASGETPAPAAVPSG